MEQSMDLALLIIRLAIGLTIFGHGYAKIFKGGKITGTAGWFDSMGMRPGAMHATLAAGGEVAAGLCFAAGLLTSVSALGIVGLMSVAGWMVHRKNGFFIIKDGWEYTFILAITAVVVAMLGPGDWSLDNAIGIDEDLDGWTGLVVAGLGGLSAATLLLSIFYHPPREENDREEAPAEAANEAETPSSEGESSTEEASTNETGAEEEAPEEADTKVEASS